MLRKRSVHLGSFHAREESRCRKVVDNAEQSLVLRAIPIPLYHPERGWAGRKPFASAERLQGGFETRDRRDRRDEQAPTPSTRPDLPEQRCSRAGDVACWLLHETAQPQLQRYGRDGFETEWKYIRV